MTMKAALYKRVSTDEQVQGTSLQTQEEALRAYCKANNIQIHKVYADDGYSGATLDRPGLRSLLADAGAQKFNLVIAYKTDRLSRSIAQAVRLVLEDFKSFGVEFKSLTEPYDTVTHMGRMMFLNLAGWGEHERALIIERSRLGRRRRAKEGKMMTNTPPYGYTKDKKGNWAIHQDQAKIYHKAIQWILDGFSTRAIVKKLNVLNVPSATGKKWQQGAVCKMLKRPFYLGQGKYATESFSVPPLITQSRWKAVQEALKGNRNSTQPHVKHFHLLRGFLYCKCGRRLFGKARNKNIAASYECPSVRPDPFPRYCGLPRVRQHKINTSVWDTVLKLVSDSEFLKQVLESNKLTQTGTMAVKEAEITVLNKAIRDKELALDRILAVYSQSESMTVQELDAYAKKIKGEISELEHEREGFLDVVRRHEKAKAAVKDLESLLAKARRRIGTFTDEQKREFLLRTVERVNVSHDGEFQLEIHFKFDVSRLGNADTAVKMVLSAVPRPA